MFFKSFLYFPQLGLGQVLFPVRKDLTTAEKEKTVFSMASLAKTLEHMGGGNDSVLNLKDELGNTVALKAKDSTVIHIVTKFCGLTISTTRIEGQLIK